MSKVNEPISNRELLAYRAELRNELFRQIHKRLALLKEKGFTQKQMAKLLSMNEGQLSRVLRGDADLRLETLSDLARALGCRIRANLVPLNEQSVEVVHASYSENAPSESAWAPGILEKV